MTSSGTALDAFLDAHGEELVVQVDNQRRNLALPRSLCARPLLSAAFEEQRHIAPHIGIAERRHGSSHNALAMAAPRKGHARITGSLEPHEPPEPQEPPEPPQDPQLPP